MDVAWTMEKNDIVFQRRQNQCRCNSQHRQTRDNSVQTASFAQCSRQAACSLCAHASSSSDPPAAVAQRIRQSFTATHCNYSLRQNTAQNHRRDQIGRPNKGRITAHVEEIAHPRAFDQLEIANPSGRHLASNAQYQDRNIEQRKPSAIRSSGQSIERELQGHQSCHTGGLVQRIPPIEKLNDRKRPRRLGRERRIPPGAANGTHQTH
ncbi:MAG: hypothetical protein CM15mP87_01400 [Candidatus Neomarinimicrobiota bacterium]|nr:MAG: hypothetical protein CM15mP87_01400 [Candidatus Neomarinimicrobiota bacterium]